MKLELERLHWQHKVRERKSNIEVLKKKNRISSEKRAQRPVSGHRPTVRVSKVKLSTTRQTPRGSLFKGTTFDLMYSVPPVTVSPAT